MPDERAQVEIQAVMDELVASGVEFGLQVAAIKNGRVVVDAVSGVADPRIGVAVSGDTFFSDQPACAVPPPPNDRREYHDDHASD